jgi:hypothetical protein
MKMINDNTTIWDIDVLDIRIKNILAQENICTVKDILMKDDKFWKMRPGLGDKGLERLLKFINEYKNLRLGLSQTDDPYVIIEKLKNEKEALYSIIAQLYKEKYLGVNLNKKI